MTQKESAIILNATDNLFSRLEVPVLYVQIQAYRRILSAECRKELSFSDAVLRYREDVFMPVMNSINNNRALRKMAKEQGLTYLYLLITEDLSIAKNITGEEYLALVSGKLESFISAA